MGGSDEYVLLTEYGFQIKDGDKVLFDTNWSLEEMLSGGPKEMTNEEVRKELNEATKIQKEATRKVNEALCHAAGRLDKAGSESFETGHKVGYDKGLTDGWELIRKLQKFDLEERENILNTNRPTICGILETLTPQQVIKKFKEYEKKKAEEERKKQEEAEKIQIGDVIGITMIFDDDVAGYFRKGVVLSVYDNSINIIDRNGNHDTIYYGSNVTIKKTGEHVDILEVLNK